MAVNITTTTTSATTQPSSSFSSVSLYVGDLDSDVKEGDLFDIFSKVGTVTSIRVCRDAITRRSLGYAYVNYLNQSDAEKALETLNYVGIKTRPCRVMWSQRDPSLRKSGKGNVFIKNLEKNITNKNLYDTFIQFGHIISCKIALDDKNESKGYGFIQFATDEAAELAIKEVNGMMISGQKVYVAQFIPRKERLAANAEKKFTNVYVKNLPENFDDPKLGELFKEYGSIKSAVVMRTNENSKGFGFINFEDADQAEKAVQEFNGKTIDGKALYCSRAQKKAEREVELKQKFEQLRNEQLARYQGVNLYIKNLDDDFEDSKLRKIFEPFGTITSARVMTEKGATRGFGFVCYSTPDEATKAVTEMNGKIVGSKPLYVALAQRKEFRRAQLEAQFATRKQLAARGFYNGPVFYQPGQPILIPPPFVSGQGGPNNNNAPMGRGGARFPFPMTSQTPGYVVLPGATRGPNMMKGQGRGSHMSGPNTRRGMKTHQGGQTSTQPQTTTTTTVVTNPTTTNPVVTVPTTNSAILAEPQPITPQITLQMLSAYSPEDQKTILGDQLYPLIEKHSPELAGKITGMILDSSSKEEMLELINNNAALSVKVEEAVKVLKEYESGHH